MGKIRRVSSKEEGFTLPELLVVIVIVGILAAIAVPNFSKARNNGHDGKAQAGLRSAVAAERTYYVDHQQYTTDGTALRKIESTISWTTTDAAANGVMAAVAASNQVVVLASTSESGKVFCIMNIAADQGTAINGQTLAGTYYGTKSTTVAVPPTSVATNTCGTTGYVRTEDGWS